MLFWKLETRFSFVSAMRISILLSNNFLKKIHEIIFNDDFRRRIWAFITNRILPNSNFKSYLPSIQFTKSIFRFDEKHELMKCHFHETLNEMRKHNKYKYISLAISSTQVNLMCPFRQTKNISVFCIICDQRAKSKHFQAYNSNECWRNPQKFQCKKHFN